MSVLVTLLESRGGLPLAIIDGNRATVVRTTRIKCGFGVARLAYQRACESSQGTLID
ncbi:MAG: hypothetical protein K2P83_00610 [Nitrosomonas sp.]|nr:hypothetical protein [Nitrosomonas sp.]